MMKSTSAYVSRLIIIISTLASSAQAQLIVKGRDTVPPADAIRVFTTNGEDVPNANTWIAGTDAEGAKRVWDFRNAPGGNTNRYFYRTPDASEADLFPGTEVAERLSLNNAPATNFAYLRYLPGEGKETLGFSTLAGGLRSESPFSDPLLEIPETFELGEKWDDETRFDITLSVLGNSIPASTIVEQRVEVDAEGEVILPAIGPVKALRINILAIWTNEALILGQVTPLGETFIRTYIWVAPGYGNVASIISKEGTAEPPDLFPVAASFERLTSATGFWEDPVPPVTTAPGTLAVRKIDGQVELQWQFPDAADAVYIIEKSATLGEKDDPWEPVAETTETQWRVPEDPTGTDYLRVRRRDE